MSNSRKDCGFIRNDNTTILYSVCCNIHTYRDRQYDRRNELKMKVLHQIGDRSLGGNFNSLEEIIAYDGPISFDGVYMSVYDNYKALKGKDITFFFSGKYLGGDNSFDVGQPLSKFCDLNQLNEMADYLGAKFGYHGWAHLRCPTLTDQAIRHELAIGLGYPSLSFAWPYGDVDDRCVRIAKELGYTEAWSVYPKGDDSDPFKKNRYFLNWDHYDDQGNNLGKK